MFGMFKILQLLQLVLTADLRERSAEHSQNSSDSSISSTGLPLVAVKFWAVLCRRCRRRRSAKFHFYGGIGGGIDTGSRLKGKIGSTTSVGNDNNGFCANIAKIPLTPSPFRP